MRTDEFDAIVVIINPYNYHFVSLFIIFSIFDKKSAVSLISDLLMMQFQNKKNEPKFSGAIAGDNSLGLVYQVITPTELYLVISLQCSMSRTYMFAEPCFKAAFIKKTKSKESIINSQMFQSVSCTNKQITFICNPSVT